MPYAVVTGATQGIGKAIAEKLLSQGYSVAICARDAGRLQQVQAEWNNSYPNAKTLCIPADISIKQEAINFAQTALAAFPAIDILVNNLGTYLTGSLADEPEGQLAHLMSVNVYSAYNITRQLLPIMKQAASGHIFNICSIGSLEAVPDAGAYSISKYALLGFSTNLHHELRPYNIKVTAICPGSVFTSSWPEDSPEKDRLIKPSDVADTIWSIASLSPTADIEKIVMRPAKG